MGEVEIRHELGSTEALEDCFEACQVFKDAGWFEFFRRLEGSDSGIAMEFAKNLERNQMEVRG